MNDEVRTGAGRDERKAGEPLTSDASPVSEPVESHVGDATPADRNNAGDVSAAQLPGREEADALVLAASRRHTRRSFLVGAAATGTAYGLYHYLNTSTGDELQPGLFRGAFRANASISRGVFRDAELSPTYPLSRAETLRVNGVYGLKKVLAPESWRLQLVGMQNGERHAGFVGDVTAWNYRYTDAETAEDQGHDTKIAPKQAGGAPIGGGNAPPSNGPMPPESAAAQGMAMRAHAEDDNHLGRKPRGMEEAGESNSTLPKGTPGVLLQLADITKLPRHELVTEFKCIEGWSQVVHWAGVRMRDFMEMYPPAAIDGKEPRYVYMETPDGDYYVGYDIKDMRHPQTLLVTEMMGAPLTQFHGAPLRLHAPIKYGYKQIKRIGLIAYTDDKPDDYWTKLGYDWYAGL